MRVSLADIFVDGVVSDESGRIGSGSVALGVEKLGCVIHVWQEAGWPTFPLNELRLPHPSRFSKDGLQKLGNELFPGLLPSTARGVVHSLKLPRVRRKHSTENCSMPTAPARAPVRALPDCDACSATSPHACLRSTPQNHRTAAATRGLRSMRPPTAGSGRAHCACANLAEPSARSAVLEPASR